MGQLNKTGGSNRMLDHTHAMFQTPVALIVLIIPVKTKQSCLIQVSHKRRKSNDRMLGVDGDSGQDLASLGMVENQTHTLGWQHARRF